MDTQYHINIADDVKRALHEDLHNHPYTSTKALPETLTSSAIEAQHDITALLIEPYTQGEAHIITREDIILCGSEWVQQAFSSIDPSLAIAWHYNDGDAISANTSIVNIRGNARSILTAERTALNFLQMLSGTATTTAHYVKHLVGSGTQLLDTRKTIPGFRQAQKYAVVCGGGKNHRMGLFDAFLIKENHIKACGSISNAITRAKQLHTQRTVEIEVENLDELEQAITAGADVIMLDNFSTEQIHQSVSINNHRCKLEVSGNITEQRLAELAKTGVDFVSTGAITKHVHAVDLSLLFL